MADRLQERGWRIDRQTDPDCLHLIVNPGHGPVVDGFLADLSDAFHDAPPSGGQRTSVVYGVTSDVAVDGELGEAILSGVERWYDGASGTGQEPTPSG